MGLFHRKSQLERLLDTVEDGVDALHSANLGRARSRAAKPVKTGLVAAGGVAALTAVSAGISSLRRRAGGASGS